MRQSNFGRGFSVERNILRLPSRTVSLPLHAAVTRALAKPEGEVEVLSENPRVVTVPLDGSTISNGVPGSRPLPTSNGVPTSAPRAQQSSILQEASPTIAENPEAIMDNDPRRIGLVEVLQIAGGPPSFIRPYLRQGDSGVDVSTLPLMLYLPGIDGTGLAASRQFPTLVEDFELVALSVPRTDRTPFTLLVQLVVDFLEDEVPKHPVDRPIYLLGESFGGLLALAVAAERPNLVDRIVLANPATCYPRSDWPLTGRLLTSIPKELWPVVPIALCPRLGNPLSLAAFGVNNTSSFTDKVGQFATGLQNLLPQLTAVSEILPPPTLAWKLKLLAEGSRLVEPKLKAIKQRVLLLSSEADWLIPSREEGPRLKELLPRCRLRMMPGRSHALLQEAGVDLPAIIKEEGFYVPRRIMSSPIKRRSHDSFGTAMPVELPTTRELAIVHEEALGWLNWATSPVFFSTRENGEVIPGLSAVPHRRPMLFVGNHQTYALDLGLLVEAIIRETGIMPRGLAHPAIWAQQTPPGVRPPARDADLEQGDGAFASFMATFGAVPVGARNFFKLMQNGETCLLYPGGVREAYKNKGEKYRVLWPEREEFVRMAAKFGATIVPLSSIGSEDAVTMLADAGDIKRIPLLGDWVAQDAREKIPQARRGASATTEEEVFIAPFSIPTALPRFYYLFGKPIELSPEDLKTEGRCQELYLQVKGEVEAGINFLLSGREKDPYKDWLPRALFEASWGGKQAPTFEL